MFCVLFRRSIPPQNLRHPDLVTKCPSFAFRPKRQTHAAWVFRFVTASRLDEKWTPTSSTVRIQLPASIQVYLDERLLSQERGQDLWGLPGAPFASRVPEAAFTGFPESVRTKRSVDLRGALRVSALVFPPVFSWRELVWYHTSCSQFKISWWSLFDWQVQVLEFPLLIAAATWVLEGETHSEQDTCRWMLSGDLICSARMQKIVKVIVVPEVPARSSWEFVVSSSWGSVVPTEF